MAPQHGSPVGAHGVHRLVSRSMFTTTISASALSTGQLALAIAAAKVPLTLAPVFLIKVREAVRRDSCDGAPTNLHFHLPFSSSLSLSSLLCRGETLPDCRLAHAPFFFLWAAPRFTHLARHLEPPRRPFLHYALLRALLALPTAPPHHHLLDRPRRFLFIRFGTRRVVCARGGITTRRPSKCGQLGHRGQLVTQLSHRELRQPARSMIACESVTHLPPPCFRWPRPSPFSLSKTHSHAFHRRSSRTWSAVAPTPPQRATSSSCLPFVQRSVDWECISRIDVSRLRRGNSERSLHNFVCM